MTDLQIQLLSANNLSALNLDSLKLFNKIKKEHAFISIPVALNGIWEVLTKNINPDNPEMMSGGDLYSPLFINTIDDAICSIIYELYKLNQKDADDEKRNTYSLLMHFADTISVFKPLYQNNDTNIITNNIKDVLESLYIGSVSPYIIGKKYYHLMYTLYNNKKIKTQDDRKIIDYYNQLFDGIFTKSENH